MDAVLPLIDWLITFALLAGLTIVSRFRRRLRALDRAAYRHFSAGLVLITVATLLRIYSSVGLLDLVPFFQEPIFGQLLTWVVIITGMTLIISGLAAWLPIVRRLQIRDREQLARLEVFRHIEQLASIEPRVEPFMRAVLRHLVGNTNFTGGIVFSCSAAGDRVKVIDQHSLPVQVDSLSLIGPGAGGIRLTENRALAELPDDLADPSLVLPVTLRGTMRAAFLLYAPDTEPVTREAALDLRLAADIIARRIADSTRQMRLDYVEQRERIYRSASRRLLSSGDTASALSHLVRDLRPLMNIDLAMLMTPSERSDSVERVTVGRSAQPLVERSVGRTEYLSRITALCGTEHPEVFSLSGSVADLTLDALPGDSKSVAVMSFPVAGEIAGLLLMAGPRPDLFSTTDLQTLEYFLPHFVTALRLSAAVDAGTADFLERRQIVRYRRSRPGIRSSLSGIFGSLELLRTGSPRTPEVTDRCLEIIDRSAHKISALVSGDPLTVMIESDTRETDATR